MQEQVINPTTLKKRTNILRRLDPAYIILLVALAVAAFWIMKLSREQVAMSKAMASMASVEGTLSGPQNSEVGDIVPPFKTQSLSGEPAEITYNGTSKYLLYIFSPSCDVCQHEIPTINKLYLRLQENGCQVKGVSIDDIDRSRERLQGKELAFDVLIMPNMAVQRTYRVVSVPQIMLVSAKGQVEWVHYGALTSDNLSGLLSKAAK
jgi:peroxiredoxin